MRQTRNPAVGPVPPNDDDNDRTYSPRMAFVHRQSCEGVKSEMDLFAVPPAQTSIEEGGWIEHQPLTSLDSGGPIEFILPGTFYEPELQKVVVSKDKTYRIEEILRWRNKRREAFVKWFGWPTAFNSWIDAKTPVNYSI